MEKTQKQIDQCYERLIVPSAVCFGIACRYWEKCKASLDGGKTE